MKPTLTRLLLDWLLPVLSGSMLALAYPPFEAAELAWVALIPLLFAIEESDRGSAFRRGYVAGLVFFGLTVWWVVHVTLPGMVGLVAFLALYFGVAGLWFNELLRHIVRGKDAPLRHLLVIVFGAAGWVLLEWVRGKFLFGGFGWNGLGVSQYRVLPLVQLASATGVYGITGLVCLLNIGFFFTLRRFVRQLIYSEPVRRRLSWELYAVMILVCGTIITGWRQLPRDPNPRELRIAMAQGNIPQSLKFDPAQKAMILRRYRELTEKASVMKPDLIIWPETATPEAVRYDLESYDLVTNMVGQSEAWLLTGTLDAIAYSDPVQSFNAAALFRPTGALERIYHKMHLVPFGEYVPLRKILPVLKWLTPIGDSFERGQSADVFEMTPAQRGAEKPAAGDSTVNASSSPYRFGVVICFEDTRPDLFRRFVIGDVDFMVNLTNDAWFKDSPAARMHLANAVFRAIESRRPLIRCTNNGVTCVVDPSGWVDPQMRLEPFTEGLLVREVPIPRMKPVTLYVRYGDWFVGLCGLLCALVTGWLAWWHLRHEPEVMTPPVDDGAKPGSVSRR